MKTLKPINDSAFVYDHIIGTGGIGSGMFFALKGNHTLSRNESRMGLLLPCMDFCKQHIILHYISVLLGASTNRQFHVYPVGRVGNDETGTKLICMMKDAGMEVSHVSIDDHNRTLFSVCFQYPDHSGGNITTANSASSKVNAGDIDAFFTGFSGSEAKEIMLAAPEVPLDARLRLLEYGRKRGSLNIASLLSSEAEEFRERHGFSLVDILSVNIDEAESITNIAASISESAELAQILGREMAAINPRMRVIVTDGKNGSYCYDGNLIIHTPALLVDAVSTAGAGDAFLAGVISALCCGLPLAKTTSDTVFAETPVESAMELGTMLAALSVTSPDTIHLSADAAVLQDFAGTRNIRLGEGVRKIFANESPAAAAAH